MFTLTALASRRRRHTIRYNQTPQPSSRRRQRATPLFLYLSSAVLVSLTLFSMVFWLG